MCGQILRAAIQDVKRKPGAALKSASEADKKAAVLDYLSHSFPRRRFKYVVLRQNLIPRTNASHWSHV